MPATNPPSQENIRHDGSLWTDESSCQDHDALLSRTWLAVWSAKLLGQRDCHCTALAVTVCGFKPRAGRTARLRRIRTKAGR
eukprot:8992375-Pyramimonas_sp.AAC.1